MKENLQKNKTVGGEHTEIALELQYERNRWSAANNAVVKAW